MKQMQKFQISIFHKNVSTGTIQMQNVISKNCLDKFSRELRKQLDVVVQWF